MNTRQLLRQIIDNYWFFPIILLNYGFFYILFGEKYPAQEGFGTDGYVYQTLITQFDQSHFFDSFYIRRIFPSFLIRNILTAFSLELSPKNIFYAFEMLSLICVSLSSFYLKKIMAFLKINLRNQMLAFMLLFVSFALLKWPFYFPAMTDTMALALSTILLYYYLRQNIIGLTIITILLAFTWPMGYYQGLLLIAFPYRKIEFIPMQQKEKFILYALSFLLFVVAFIYVILIKKTDTNLIFVPKIEKNLLAFNFFFLLIVFMSFARLFFNAELFNLKLFFNSLNYIRIGFAAGIFSIIMLAIWKMGLPKSTVYETSTIIENPIVYASVRPMLTIVSHYAFFGTIVCLVILFWSSLTKAIAQSGWALVGAFALNLYLFGIMPESRTLINLFPWITIFLIYGINKYSFSNSFYIVVGCLCVLTSKIWFLIDYEMDYELGMVVDKNGSIDFPNQRFFMNLGPWMSEKAYYIHGTAMLLNFMILFFLLYRVKILSNYKIVINRKY